MNDAQKQALQRFVAVLIAEVATLVVAALSSPQLVELISVWAGKGSVLTTLILTLLPPFALAIAKLASGATEKPEPVGDNVRGVRIAKAREPGLFD